MNSGTEARRLQRRLDTIERKRVKATTAANKRHASRLSDIDLDAAKAVGDARGTVSDSVLGVLDALNQAVLAEMVAAIETEKRGVATEGGTGGEAAATS